MPDCLSFSQLIQYRAGAWSLDREEHLRACPSCQGRLQLVADGDDLEAEIRRVRAGAGSSPIPLLPTHIGDYRPVAEIGRGGMGVVYEAVQEKLQRRVALKVLPGLLNSLRPESAIRFRTEAAAAARLHHPNIVPIFDYGEEAGCHYYAMELIQGWALNEVIPRAANRPWGRRATSKCVPSDGPDPATPELLEERSFAQYSRRVAALFCEVAGALQFAHDSGVVHRDIKPSNLILSRSGRLMVGDFGLAKLDHESVTCPGQLIGTLRYMSPEQLGFGDRAVDHRTDVYSLGATLYEMIAFRPAVAGADDPALMRRVAEDEPLPLRRVQPQAPRELEVICAKALIKDARDRYPSAAALQADLQRFLEDRPLLARPPDWHTRAWKLVRRNPLMVATVGVGVFAATSVLSTALYYDSRRERGELRVRYAADLVTLGREHLAGGSPHMAVDVLTRALDYDGDLSYVHTLRAAAYARLHDYDRAIEDWTHAIQATAGRPNAYLRRGLLRLLKGDPQGAIGDFHQARELSPRLQEARVFAMLADAAAGSLETQADRQDAGTPEEESLALLQRFLATGEGAAEVLKAAGAGAGEHRGLMHCAVAEEQRRRGRQAEALRLFREAADMPVGDDVHFFIQARAMPGELPDTSLPLGRAGK